MRSRCALFRMCKHMLAHDGVAYKLRARGFRHGQNLYRRLVLAVLHVSFVNSCRSYTVNRHGSTVQIDWYWGTRLAERDMSARWNTSATACSLRPVPMHLASERPAESAYSSIVGSRLNVTPNDRVSWVRDPEHACICVINDPGSPWRHACRNVILVSPNRWPGNHMDRPGVSDVPNLRTEFGTDAALVMAGHVREEFIPGFDIMLPRLRADMFDSDGKWNNLLGTQTRRLRPSLVFFSGTYEEGWPMPWYNQRISLGKLHDPSRGVNIRLTHHGAPAEPDWRETFVNFLAESYFAFVVGGGGIDTYRFLEALSLGAIPVVFDDLILPFEFSVVQNWEDCAVRLPFSEIETSINRLEGISLLGRLRRQRACSEIFNQYFSSSVAIRRAVLTSIVESLL